MTALQAPDPRSAGVLVEAEPAGPDAGYSRWPSWAGWVEELGQIVSEERHPWWTLAGGLFVFGMFFALIWLVLAAGAPPVRPL